MSLQDSKHGADMIEDRDDVSSLEKEAITRRSKPGLSAEDAEWLDNVQANEQSRIFRKVDKRLVPTLALLYLIAHLDRANIGNAKIEGLEASLNMSGTDYNLALAAFFPGYILCEVPSNVILSKFKRPSWYMATLVICWGTIMTFTTFGGLVATRVLLGIFEAGFFPGAIIGQWYPPNRSQGRMAFFYLASAMAGAFSGLLAAGLARMDGLGGYEGWRWIFIIEGIASVVVGVMCIFLLPDDPLTAKWLRPDEVRFLHLNHISTRGVKVSHKEEKMSKRAQLGILSRVLGDPQLYLQSLVFMSNTVPNYGLKFTMPQIIRNMGFRATTAQLLTAPPYTSGAIAAVISAYFADRLTWRMPFIVFHQGLLIIAYAILFVKAEAIADNVPLCYFCVFLACIGVYPIIPGCNVWTINNLAGAEKRAMGIAFMIALGNCGGIPGSFIFLENESPKYPTGFGGSLGFASAGMTAAFILELMYWSHNKRWEDVPEEEIRQKYSDDQLEQMGNKSPLFKYAL